MTTARARLSAPKPPRLTQIVSVHADPEKTEFETLRLGNILQSTLEINELIALFVSELAAYVAFSSCRYQSQSDHLTLNFGSPGPFTCSYRLVIFQESLGELTLTHNGEFSAATLQKVETCLTALVYPLRNALLYHRALTNAMTDPVTGIHNRAAFNNTLQRELQLARRHGHELSMLMVDADHFKHINDTYGHVIGDTLLRGLAERLTNRVRGCDMVFRYGGEEFAIVLSSTCLEGAAILATKIRSWVECEPFNCDSLQIQLTISLGVGTLHPDDTVTSLIERTDRALYIAKQEGRNRVVTEQAISLPSDINSQA